MVQLAAGRKEMMGLQWQDSVEAEVEGRGQPGVYGLGGAFARGGLRKCKGRTTGEGVQRMAYLDAGGEGGRDALLDRVADHAVQLLHVSRELLLEHERRVLGLQALLALRALCRRPCWGDLAAPPQALQKQQSQGARWQGSG